MTPEREEEIRRAWEDGKRRWLWGPPQPGYFQALTVPIMPPLVFGSVADDPVPEPAAIRTVDFIGSYATFPGGDGPDRPRYRFITCEGLVLKMERVQ